MTSWYVLTPAGKAGPYRTASEAREAAKPFGWEIVRQTDEEAEA